MFWTHAGPVLGIAELLSPCSAVRIGLQPFRFIAMDNTDLQTLRVAIASSEVYVQGFRPDAVEISRAV